MPIDYSKSKIYKLVCDKSDNIYIGSTCNRLSTRLSQHKTSYKLWKNGKGRYMKSYDLFDKGLEDVKIYLVEECNCKTKEQLHAKERYYIESIKESNNKIIPTRSRKERYDSDRNYYLEKKKEYRKNHKEEINEYKKSIFKCECGSEIRKNEKYRHLRTNKHLNFIKVKENIEQTTNSPI